MRNVSERNRIQIPSKKCIAALLTVFVWALPGFAVGTASTLTLDFQGFITDITDAPLNGPVGVEFRIYDQPTSGTAYWGESQTVTATDGAFFARLGTGLLVAPFTVPLST